MTPAIAIVGMACRYPDARTPRELWENVLAQRRAFRRLPPERLRLEDYLSDDRAAPDTTYSTEAAVIEGYEFDRARFRVAGSTFRAADLAHWLALEVAADALGDAGFPDGDGLPREACGVLLGNTLTGEFARANLMRLRWPYVRRVVDAALEERGWPVPERFAFLDALAEQYKTPFPPVGDETLAGGLSNTIAGRICNHFDLGGGGYTVDGACSSSLLAVVHACTQLVAGDLDMAMAGGVDLSLDPFELVGFAKAGALAAGDMRVFDARPTGFWPGEGCGFVVLMRHEDAVAERRRVYAVVRGWGVSSDGCGGITRPEVAGQTLALRRAYRRAGFGIDTVAYFEGHGTGTEVGDATELRTLARARRVQAPAGGPAAIGSIKANIGHTKAAAGVAGLIKATLAIDRQILPPATGWEEPHPVLAEEGATLRLPREGAAWPAAQPLRAAVSGMGFGGINTHIVLEGVSGRRRRRVGRPERALLSSAQDAELFLLRAPSKAKLEHRVRELLSFSARLSRSELTDLAAELAGGRGAARWRAALVASSPSELTGRLQTLGGWLSRGVKTRVDPRAGAMLGHGAGRPAIGFLFPGQGSPAHLRGGAWRRRFDAVARLYQESGVADAGNGAATQVAQPAIMIATLAGLSVLDRIGVAGTVGVGHSLGELAAYHWAGAFDRSALLRLAAARGKAMSDHAAPNGAMASIAADEAAVAELLAPASVVVVAGINSPSQTVVAGESAAVDALIARAREAGLAAARLQVSHAFHSPLVAGSAPAFARAVAREQLRALALPVVSTVTGDRLKPDEDLGALLQRQFTSPVRFMDAVRAADAHTDLWIEVGPGQVLQGIVRQLVDTPVVSLDTGGDALRPMLRAVGAAFVLGAPVRCRLLFADRFVRPFDLDWRPRFFVNPCELAPGQGATPAPRRARADRDAAPPPSPESRPDLAARSPLEVVRALAAERAELPLSAVGEDDRLLGDLHLSSLVVSQLYTESARVLGLTPPVPPGDAANATVREVARALAELSRAGAQEPAASPPGLPAGVDAWTRAFTVERVERRLPRGRVHEPPGSWRVLAPPDHPLREPLQQALDGSATGGGVVVCLPPDPDDRCIDLLLDGARAVLAGRMDNRFVLVQHDGGAAAFARSLHLESPAVTTCVVEVPADHPQAVDWVLAECQTAAGYQEAHYDRAGVRTVPVLRLLSLPEQPAPSPLSASDVLLVTGGGKGIAAECALSLARETGVRLALLGRSEPAADAGLAANLERMAAAGVRFEYIAADVTDAQAVRTAVGRAEAGLGPISAVMHGAGVNAPQRIESLDRAAVLRTVGTKVHGARNVLAAIDPARLRLLVTFSSIIARTGMHGQADYALANQWLTDLTERWQKRHPHCRCLAVEWSVWSGLGMGERLGTMEALRRQGITPTTVDDGVRVLQRLIEAPLSAVSVVVTGRFGDPPTLTVDRPELPLLRFLEQPRVFVPGVELVVDARLSGDADPYLRDHVYQGTPTMPAVIGLEAMAQATMALTSASDPPGFAGVEFIRPIVVPEGEPVTVRIAALVRRRGLVEVVLRSQATGFQVDHFRATCRVGGGDGTAAPPRARTPAVDHGGGNDGGGDHGDGLLPLDPRTDLYDRILFHNGRFQRVAGYRRLSAVECVAEVTTDGGGGDWFGRYLPPTLVLGDPAARDAAVHAVQACIPHGTVLPIGVDRWTLVDRTAAATVVSARERFRNGDDFVYDLEVTGEDGGLLERWEGLRLRRVDRKVPGGKLVEPLLGPYLERRIDDLVPGAAVSVLVERAAGADRRARSDRAIARLLGAGTEIHRRPDGKPEVGDGREVSVSHAGDLTLAAAAVRVVACDAEPVRSRHPGGWRDLLGVERYALSERIARESGGGLNAAATRVWAATECLRKAGAAADAALVLETVTPDDWVVLRAGRLDIATWVRRAQASADGLTFAVLAENDRASL